ncbi:MAG: hypothetical protein JXA28_03140, partial [Bacteroidetes bacterium]|nr:hypothetical protein [Bacteroidota bacterium]
MQFLRYRFPLRFFIFTACLLLYPASGHAQMPYVETDIPVRDGKTLAADIYHNTGWTAKPVILVQTPYNKNMYRITLSLPGGGVFPLDTMRYHYVMLDWRGFF